MSATTESKLSGNAAPRVEPRAYKLTEACIYLGGLSGMTIRRLVKRGLLKPNRSIRHLLFTKSELDRFLAN